MATSRVIGLDIGTTAVRAAEIEFGAGGPKGKGQPTLLRAGQVPLPLGAVRDGEVADPGTVAEAIKQLWASAHLQSKDVVIGVGNQRVVVRELDLPWMPAAQLKESLPFQVQEMLPMSIDEALLDFHVTGEDDTEAGRVVHGMLVAAQRETVVANVLAVESAGLRPSMVDLNAFALIRGLARGEQASATLAFVDIGAVITTVVVSAQGAPRLVRSLPVGGAHITNAVASALSISAHDAEQLKRSIGIGAAQGPENAAASEAIVTVARSLVEAVRNTFVYYAGNNPGHGLQGVVLTGGGAHLPGLGQYLSSASRLPVVLGDALGGLRTAKQLSSQSLAGAGSLMALSIGLAYGVAA
ncbi:MAG: pilus assembly protein PilM [Cellulomonas sp.]|nr:pilus assembly protein PilM [Cellulomonas sp.]